MVRKETIKQRAIYVYLPSLKMVERWKTLAKKQGLSVSKFVVEHVENSLMQEEDPSYRSRSELLNEIYRLREELVEERKKNVRLDIVAEKLEGELRRYRAQPFLMEGFEGVRSFHKELIGLLRAGRNLSSEDILSMLRIDPKEHETVKAISKQLEILESYGLVKSTPRGWRWTE